VIASNDPFVMSAWGKANYTKDDFIVSFFFFFFNPRFLSLLLLSSLFVYPSSPPINPSPLGGLWDNIS
jgi:hypothetical protein